ncbi:hypothetical protein GCM10007301_01760 [Azorhizobium oxalatiphilum]|uniref:DUF2218 domain-containing protein n=1 Tax=Azorhizobium oxalatiphilum TaxID=980631 RepID=A0A917BKR1_9HYPH|nr:DUF2218 domain-containing protein [Azorhizobium oxalatiphilum]GGF45916.1 hypothetical protein GCM10007301_01760 [Azorhizobium oxalatiphilum]
MSHSSTARIPTLKGDGYLKQLAKHWGHKLEIAQAEGTCTITFPRDLHGADWPGPGVVTLTAEPDMLVCDIIASADGQLDGLKEVVSSHLDRFAFREAPLPFAWS